jgi:hypothetical protein
MSNALAIATVTATLQQQLAGALATAGIAGAQVTTVRPDAPAGLPNPGVNIFLYQVTMNPSWRNADLPARQADGSLLRRPQTALDLHYLLTFHGDDATLDQQRLLGVVARQFHAAPVLSRDAVRQAQSNIAVLANADLADQVELVRIRPVGLSLDELSKLWSIFPEADYVLSAVYVAGVVLIATDDTPPAAPPAPRQPSVTSGTFAPAIIDAVEPQPVELAPSPPTPITLVGANLDPSDEVTFTTPGKPDPIPGTVGPGPGGARLSVFLPAGLRPGVNTVQLTQLAPAVSPPSTVPRPLAQSNAALFLLRPTIVSLGPGSPPGSITAVVSPPVGPRQQVSMLLNGTGSPAAAFLLAAAPHPAETDTFVFNVAKLRGGSPPGVYLARIRVDEAESRLNVDASGKFFGPTVTI